MTALHVLQVLHGVTAVLMAWPFYALLITGERARLGPPLDRTDTYMETLIRHQTVRCLVYQVTLLITGPLIVVMKAGSAAPAILAGGNLRVLAKEGLVLLLLGMALYMHFYLQPRINRLVADGAPSAEARSALARLRGRRRWMAAVCLWYVLVAVTLGLQVWQPFGRSLTLVMAGVAALFVVRVHRTRMRWGWV